MSRLVPQELAETLLARVSSDAQEVDWDHLTQADKTAQLAKWVEAPEVGGVLRPLVGGDAEVRMWLKEVALKRRARAQQPDPDAVIGQLFRESVRIIEGSVGTKPHHVLVQNGTHRYYVCWGPQANAKHLFWAALNAREDDPRLDDAWVVIVDTIASPTPADRRIRLSSLAERCHLKIDWMGA
jgi:hypothetical protein